MITWEWLAGFFDGEGSAGVYGKRGSRVGCFQASIAQSGEPGRKVMMRIKEFVESQGIACCFVVNWSDHGNHRRLHSYRLQFTSRPATIGLLQHLLPYLQVKKTNAQDIVRYAVLYPDSRTYTSGRKKKAA